MYRWCFRITTFKLFAYLEPRFLGGSLAGGGHDGLKVGGTGKARQERRRAQGDSGGGDTREAFKRQVPPASDWLRYTLDVGDERQEKIHVDYRVSNLG